MNIDFTNCQINKLKWFGGANGNKISVKYKNEDYMLKFPPKANKNPFMSYANSCISEYVACHIFNSLGIDTQETLLGKYNGTIVVACKDLEVNGYKLKDFAYLKNTIIDSESNGYGTDLESILNAIDSQQILSPDKIKDHFWNMFIADALLGNFDRHNGNWGFLINEEAGIVRLSPVFDCGSCLYPQLEDSRMKHILENENEINDRIYVYPTSAIRFNNKKINYLEFISSDINKDCTRSLKTIEKNVNMTKIDNIIENTPFITDIHREFLKTMIVERKAKIIDKSIEIIQSRELERKRRARHREER